MDEQALVDLTPVLQMLLTGVLLAAGPLLWVWLRQRRASMAQRLRALTLLTLFFTFDLVLFGAFTRLTDSGLGCPDWPGCYGSASPLGAKQEITEAQTAMPTGPVTHRKAWIEMVHRYLATGVGGMILTLALLSAWDAYRRRRSADTGGLPAISPWWPALTLVWVCVQGAFGALTVTMKLFPAIVTLHLLGALVLLALLTVQVVRYSHVQALVKSLAVPSRLRRGIALALALVWLQVALGGWVSTNYAVLACTEFPKCQASWWPAMDFLQGFELWRELGRTGAGSHLSFEALTAIHYTHRLVAYAVVAVLVWQVLRMASTWALRVHARWLVALLLLQLATGLSNVVLGWPLLAAVLHTGGAAALVVVLTHALASTRQSEPRVVLAIKTRRART